MMAVGLGVVGTMMHLGIATHGEQIFTVAMLLVFIVGFAMSAGPLIWTLCSEVQPLKGRDFGIGCSTFTNWIANMIVGATFLTLLNGIGNAATFWLYAALNARLPGDHVLAGAGNEERHPGADRAQPDGRQAAARDRQ